MKINNKNKAKFALKSIKNLHKLILKTYINKVAMLIKAYKHLSFTCEPVIITGFPKFSSMKERADAVYAIVSVP